jgi:DNA polymerase-3 subunit gamma/tau
MQYTALYREFRPYNFDTIAGQELIVQTLRNQITTERISHAYLFCGPRGTGKTSTAKVFAKAVNCLQPENGNPCGHCRPCVELASDNNMDILEIDAASNNGVDEIRELRDKIHYPPSIGKYRVYIIDEVHMLSIGAFNALLKTLEEPPSHALFILATTEQQKLPATILSRCQRYNFKRIAANVISEQLTTIAEAKGVGIDMPAKGLIAYWAEGGLRDAISLLDQCLTFTEDTVTEDTVLQVLGTANRQFVFALTDDLLQGKMAGLLEKINQLVEEGKDMRVFIKDLTNHLRNVMIARFVPDCSELFSVDATIAKAYQAQAKQAGEERLLRAVEQLTLLEGLLRYTAQPRILMEVAFLKICHPEDEVSLVAVNDRITQIEKKLSNLSVADLSASTNLTIEKMPVEPKRPMDSGKKIAKEATKQAVSEEKISQAEPQVQLDDVIDQWKKVLQDVKKKQMGTYVLLSSATVMANGPDIIIEFPNEKSFCAEAIRKPDNLELIQQSFQQHAGKELRIKVEVASNLPKEEIRVKPVAKPSINVQAVDEQAQAIKDFFDGDDIDVTIIDK